MNAYFFAMLHRMRYIRRWSLMRNTETENIQEHSLEVAYLAHALALARKRIFPERTPVPDPSYCVLLALYHDASEIITGDLPTPVKYFNDGLRSAFGEMEEEAVGMMLNGIPQELRGDYEALLSVPSGMEAGEQEARRIVKAADTLSAYLKCLDEMRAGNHEFVDAAEATRQKLEAMDLPELKWFMELTLPAYGLTLDELRTKSHGEGADQAVTIPLQQR